jgi:hypothetical protein
VIEATVISAAEEADLLKEWFETVHFDVESEGIPELLPERDDEESRAIEHASLLAEWLYRGATGEPPIVDSGAWDYIDFDQLGMNEATARSIYDSELSFHLLFLRGNPNHSKKNGQFVKGGGGSASPKGLSNTSPVSSANPVDAAIEKGKSDPDMMVMSSMDTHPFGKHWQASGDMEERAGALWSESYAGHKQVTKAVANNKEGKPTLEGIDATKGHKLTLLQAGAQDLEDGTRTPGKYKKENLEADIRNSANVLQARMDTAPTHRTPLHRGLLMSKDKLPKAGDTFDTPISSWSKQRSNAEVYAYARENEALGIVGDHHVVMRMVGPKKSADISDIVGSGIIDDEHLAQGKFKINRVTKKGKSVNIEVEQVL